MDSLFIVSSPFKITFSTLISPNYSSFSLFKFKTRKGFNNSSKPQNPNKIWGNYSINPIKPFSHSIPFFQKSRDLAAKYLNHNCETGYLQNGDFGTALMSITATAKVKVSPLLATLAANPTFVSGLCAWAVAQSMKIILNFFVERKWDFRIIFASGGMPSSHSALCTALTTSVAICHGVADSLFPVCLGFSLIVMYDAIGVRRHAGMQAEVTVCLFLRSSIVSFLLSIYVRIKLNESRTHH